VFRSRPVSLALVGLFLWVTACTSYKQIEPAEVTDHGKVRVTRTDGVRETLRDPWVAADSIRGHEKPGTERDYSDPIVIIPLDQVGTLEVSYVNGGKTVVFVAAVIVGALLIGGLACGGACSPDFD